MATARPLKGSDSRKQKELLQTIGRRCQYKPLSWDLQGGNKNTVKITFGDLNVPAERNCYHSVSLSPKQRWCATEKGMREICGSIGDNSAPGLDDIPNKVGSEDQPRHFSENLRAKVRVAFQIQ